MSDHAERRTAKLDAEAPQIDADRSQKGWKFHCPGCGATHLSFVELRGPKIPSPPGVRREWDYKCMTCLRVSTFGSGGVESA